MINNKEVKLMYSVLKGLDRDYTEEESKLLKKLDIMSRQIDIMEESQEKMAKLQDEMVALDKGE